ncbi:MAG: radical SAM protein [Oscillospiraceae bacterium]|nr:radical SAM protein [Oscillospiraceae bacterium]
MKHSNIAIFIPHMGCPHLCSFCNQRNISGEKSITSGDDVRKICSSAMSEISDKSNTEIAFFGGSFTALDRGYMLELLSAAYDFVGEGKFKGIRISTRPDYIDDEVLSILKKYGVTSIELGAQSMSDKVLEANERGHSAKDVKKASLLIKQYGFELGLQMMVGLYQSTESDDYFTMCEIIALKPDTVRIYPVVVLKDTKLGELYQSGRYKLYDFDKAVEICANMLYMFEFMGIKVIRLGLHASKDVSENAVAGFYHDSFREMCESYIFRTRIMTLLKNKKGEFSIEIPKGSLSKAVGQKKVNIEYFRKNDLYISFKENSELHGYCVSIKEVK